MKVSKKSFSNGSVVTNCYMRIHLNAYTITNAHASNIIFQHEENIPKGLERVPNEPIEQIFQDDHKTDITLRYLGPSMFPVLLEPRHSVMYCGFERRKFEVLVQRPEFTV